MKTRKTPMNTKKFLTEFVVAFGLIFMVTVILLSVWNLVRHGESTFNWKVACVLAVIFSGVAILLDHKRIKGNN